VIPQDGKASEVLARVRRSWSPDPDAAGRVRLGIEAKLRAAAATPAPGAARWSGRILLAGAVALVAGGSGYWAGFSAGRRSPSPPLVRTLPTAPAGSWRSEPPAAPAVAATVAVPGRAVIAAPASFAAAGSRREARVARHAPQAQSPGQHGSQDGSLAAELRAVRGAERALRDGRPGLALALLQDLDRQVPHGQLTEEREATATLARCASDDQPFDVNLGEQFTARHPNSVYRARVEQVCARTDGAAPGDSTPRRSGP